MPNGNCAYGHSTSASGRTRAGMARRMPGSRKAGIGVCDGASWTCIVQRASENVDPKGAGQVARNPMIGIERVLVEGHVRAVRQRLPSRPRKARSAGGRSAASVTPCRRARSVDLRAVEQPHDVAGLIAEQGHRPLGIEHRRRHPTVAVVVRLDDLDERAQRIEGEDHRQRIARRRCRCPTGPARTTGLLNSARRRPMVAVVS